MSKLVQELENFSKFWKRSKGYIDNRVTVNPDMNCRVELTIDGNRYAVYQAVPLIAPQAPTFDPSLRTFDKSVTITMSCTTPDTSIFYTHQDGTVEASLNPADPTMSSTPYRNGIPLYAEASVASKYFRYKAISEDKGELSTVTDVTFRVDGKANDPSLSQATATYTDDSISLTMSCDSPNPTIYYTKSADGSTTDPGTPTHESSVYSSALTLSGTTKVNAISASPNWKDSDVVSRTYTFKTKKPVLSYSGSETDATREVSLYCENSNATIYYTVGADGGANPDDPTTESSVWDPSTSTLSFDKKKTIKALAVKDNRSDSDIETLTCGFKVATPTITVTQTDAYDESISFKMKNNDVGDASIYVKIGSADASVMGLIASGDDTASVPLSSITGEKTVTIKSYGTRDYRDNSDNASTTITYGRTPFMICTPQPSIAKTYEEAKTALTNETLNMSSLVKTQLIKVSEGKALNKRNEVYNTTVEGLFIACVPKNWGIPKTDTAITGKIVTTGGPFNLFYVGTLQNWNCYSSAGTLSIGDITYIFKEWE